jgi:hypothetical protein
MSEAEMDASQSTRTEVSGDYDGSAWVIELDDEAAGVAFAVRGGVRFAASDTRFWALDGERFASVAKAHAAVRRLAQLRPQAGAVGRFWNASPDR